MARKLWSKYVIGITSVIAIGGFIGLTQKIDAINYPNTDSPSSRLPVLNEDGSTDSIEQEFQIEQNFPSWDDDDQPRKHRHHDEDDSDDDEDEYEDWSTNQLNPDSSSNQDGTSTRTRIRSRAS